MRRAGAVALQIPPLAEPTGRIDAPRARHALAVFATWSLLAEAEQMAEAARAAGCSAVVIDPQASAVAGELSTLQGLAQRLAPQCRLSGPLTLVTLGCDPRLRDAMVDHLLMADAPLRLAVAVAEERRDTAGPLAALAERYVAAPTLPPRYRLRMSPPDSTQTCDAWVRALLMHPTGALPDHEPAQLIPLKSGSATGSAVFCIPGAGASIISFLDLTQEVDDRTPVYGLQPRGLEVGCPPHATARDAALAMLPLVEPDARRRPVRLVGHSYGGFVALELAFLLADRGLAPLGIGIIDTTAPQYREWPAEIDETEVVSRWLRLNEEQLGRSMGLEIEDVPLADRAAMLDAVHGAMVRAGLLPHLSRASALDGSMRMFAACIRAWYSPTRRYDGRVDLIYLDQGQLTAVENTVAAEQMASGWRKLAPHLTFHRTPGNHMTGLRAPHVAALARALGLGRANAASA